MLDDSIYRKFHSMPFSEQLERSYQSVELRQTLLINEIFKCGKDIFGNTQNEYENENKLTLRNRNNNFMQKQPSQKKYVYEYDYNKDKTDRTQNNVYDDYSADQISFTLSSQDNPRNSSKESHLSPNPSFHLKDQKYHITWKNQLINENNRMKDQNNNKQYLSEFIQNQLKTTQKSHQKVGKWQKPVNSKIQFIKQATRQKSKQSSPQKIQKQSPIKIKDNLYKKTFDLSSSKLNYFPDPTKKRKSIFQQKSPKKVTPSINQLNYSSYHPQQKKFTFKTPQKNVIKKSQIPLSQQITKNVYGRLKSQVSGNSFIKQFESQQKKTQQESQMIWKGFINRSDQWIEKKKCHLIEKQTMQKYQPNYSSSKHKDQNSPNKQFYSYADMKYQQKAFNNKNFQMKFQQKKFQPEYTFRNKKREQNSKSAKKKEKSVQNCINKLKTQTELLKVKLLSPLKNQIDDNQILNHYKELNQSQSKRLVRKFSIRQENQFNKVLKDHSGFNQINKLYGNIIGYQKVRQIRRN